MFDPDTLGRTAPLPLAEPTKEWAWGNADGAGVKVAVIDSGVDADHPLVHGLAGAVVVEFEPDAENQVRYVPGPHEDLVGHGTACAGIIRRVAPRAEIYSVRVLGATLRGRAAVFAGGLRWAIDNGMHVLNLSLSTGKSEWFGPLHELADEAYFRNIILVSAVNNVPGPSYPSLYSSVLSVAAHPGSDPWAFDYNPAPPVEFGAPGVDVEVAWLNGSNLEVTGNSFAASHIAGLVTRLLSKHRGLTPFQVKAVLQAMASNAR